jgi:hypothetical protein
MNEAPRVHQLKTRPFEFAAVADGRKTFDIRRDDRGYAVGDILDLAEWEPAGRYTGRCQRVQVTYLLTGPDAQHFGLAPQHVAMGITRLGRIRPCD